MWKFLKKKEKTPPILTRRIASFFIKFEGGSWVSLEKFLGDEETAEESYKDFLKWYNEELDSPHYTLKFFNGVMKSVNVHAKEDSMKIVSRKHILYVEISELKREI